MNNIDETQLKDVQVNEKLINLLLFALGIILIIVGAFVQSRSSISTICLGIGCSLIASAIVTFLNAKYALRKQFESLVSEEWGLCAIYPTRQKMNDSCDIALQKANKQIDMIGFGFRSLRDSQTELIREKVRRGIKVRIISMDPESVFLAQREKDEKVSAGSIKDSIYQLIEWVADLNRIATKKNQVELRFYDSLIQDFYFRVDNHVFVGPYLYGKQSQQTISYEYKGRTEGTKHYMDYFEMLWRDKEYCKAHKF